MCYLSATQRFLERTEVSIQMQLFFLWRGGERLRELTPRNNQTSCISVIKTRLVLKMFVFSTIAVHRVFRFQIISWRPDLHVSILFDYVSGFLFNFHDEEALPFLTVSTLLLSGTDRRRPQNKNELNSVNNIVPVSAVASHTSSPTDL